MTVPSLGRGRARWLLFAAAGAYFGLPVLATALYAFATVWRSKALPDGYTLDHVRDTFGDDRLVAAVGRSLLLGGLAVLIINVVVLPPLYWARVRNPQLRSVMQTCALLPFALPFLVIAYGIKNLAGANGLTAPWSASWQLVLLGHVALAFPFFLWPVDGAMAAADVRRLHEAAATSGAGPVRTLLAVVVPNIRTGILTGSILAFATSFGEYSIARIITGTSYETLPVWMVNELNQTAGNRFGVAVMTITSFLIVLAVSVVVAVAARDQPVQLLPGVSTAKETP